SASKNGLTTESVMVNLPAGGSASTNLTLKFAATTLVGSVLGAQDSEATATGLPGAQITVTKGTEVRTATTITDGNLVGQYRLPNLGPGTYSVTTSAAGYLTQTQQVK